MFRRIGIPAFVATEPEQLERAHRIVLPGIGQFDTCAGNLKKLGFTDVLHDAVLNRRIPVLGICVGAQLLTRGSEEGSLSGLGWIDAEVRRFRRTDGDGIKVPHMGWNIVARRRRHQLFEGFEADPRFYFVHSYYIKCDKRDNVLGQTRHGIEFESAIVRDHIVGVQFHPEKSHIFGMRLMRSFGAVEVHSC